MRSTIVGLLLGTSGWQYADWRGPFYPQKLPQRRWLEHYAQHFSTVEVNNAFYRLPERATFEAWRARTPAGFIVTVKASRYLTHIKRLRDPAEPVARLMERATGLGDRLGAVLLQLPPTLQADPPLLAETLKHFPDGVRVAVEPRHPSGGSRPCRACSKRPGPHWLGRPGRAARDPAVAHRPTGVTCACTTEPARGGVPPHEPGTPMG